MDAKRGSDALSEMKFMLQSEQRESLMRHAESILETDPYKEAGITPAKNSVLLGERSQTNFQRDSYSKTDIKSIAKTISMIDIRESASEQRKDSSADVGGHSGRENINVRALEGQKAKDNQRKLSVKWLMTQNELEPSKINCSICKFETKEVSSEPDKPKKSNANYDAIKVRDGKKITRRQMEKIADLKCHTATARTKEGTEVIRRIVVKNINDVYKFVGRIKTGTYTTINKYYSTVLNEEIAIKIIPKIGIPSKRLFKYVPRELDLAEDNKFRHPNIVKFLETYDIGLRSYIMMEYVDGGNLTDYIKSRGRLDPLTYQSFFRQLITAVIFCLDHGICHRKLSTENCLVTKDANLKLCDFSYSQEIEHADQVLDTYCGVLGYLAPEILMCRDYSPNLTEAWSCGVILFVMIYGRMPFNSSNFAKLLKQVKQPIKYHWYCDTPFDAVVIMNQTISPVRRRRDLREVLRHQWVTPIRKHSYDHYMKRTKIPSESTIRKELIDMINAGYDIPLEMLQEQNAEEENNEIEQLLLPDNI